MIEERITKTSISGVYKITCKANGKVYIGSSNNIPVRWRRHLYQNLVCDLYRDMSKYGLPSFVFEILIECEPEERRKHEAKFIKEYSSYKKEFGYNIHSK